MSGSSGTGAAAICTGADFFLASGRAFGGRSRYSIIPVDRSAKRLLWVSSLGREIMATISRALSVPSTREST